MIKIHSPITGRENICLERKIPSEFLIKNYSEQLKIDVGKYFKGVSEIKLYRCLDTGYRFFYPFEILGDAFLYQELSKHVWYYSDWKWEHKIASGFVTDEDKILEIGCARGSFLHHLRRNNLSEAVGIELNSDAAECGRKNGENILEESIQEHAKKRGGFYDIICSFQVAEHIPDVKSFLDSSLVALKKGGKLIFSVPNTTDDSIFLKDNVLNMPPHHMGLWNIVSVANIPLFFNVSLEHICFETPSPQQLLAYRGLIRDTMVKRFGVPGYIYYGINRKFITHNLNIVKNWLPAHTVLVVYKKT